MPTNKGVFNYCIGDERMTEKEKFAEIETCKIILRYLRKPHWSYDILLRPFRIFYYQRRIEKLEGEVNHVDISA